MRDMYIQYADNKAIILPDWRIRASDFIPRLGLFMGSLNGLNDKRQKSVQEQVRDISILSSVQFVMSSKRDQIRNYVA